MSTNNAESLNLKLNATNSERKYCNFKILTLEKMVKWIKSKNLDQEVEEELIKKVGKYPNSSLSSFMDNFSKHLSNARKIVRDRTPLYTRELGDDDDDELESNPFYTNELGEDDKPESSPFYTNELGEDDEPESNPHTALLDGFGISKEIPESPHEDSFG